MALSRTGSSEATKSSLPAPRICSSEGTSKLPAAWTSTSAASLGVANVFGLCDEASDGFCCANKGQEHNSAKAKETAVAENLAIAILVNGCFLLVLIGISLCMTCLPPPFTFTYTASTAHTGAPAR